MDYWDNVLNEITEKSPKSLCYIFTNLYAPEDETLHEGNTQTNTSHDVDKKEKKQYYLCGTYAHTYLTQREAECIYLLANGHTLKKTGDSLKLSHRTVEFYLNNVKEKMNLRTKKQVLHAIYDTDFLDAFCKEQQQKHACTKSKTSH